MKKLLTTLIIGLFFSLNANSQWTQQNNGITDSIGALSFSYFHHNGNDVYVSGTGYVAPNLIGGFFHSDNNGNSWTKVYGFGRGVLFSSGGRLLTGLNGSGGVMYSTDHGANWTAANGMPGAVNIVGFAANASNTKVFAANMLGSVYQSTDNGSTWTLSGTGYSGDARAIAVNGNVILAGGNEGIFKSTDDGATWTAAITGITTTSKMTTFLVMTNSVAMAVSGGNIYKSTDQGANWVKYIFPIGDIASYGIFDLYADTNGHMLGKGYSTIVHSTDHGATWNMIQDGLPTYSGIHTASAIYLKNGIAWAGTSTVGTTKGEGIFRNVLYGTVGIKDISANTVIEVYPNPVNAEINLKMQENSFGGYVSIYNSVGLVILKEKITQEQMTISTEQLANGVYYLRVNTSRAAQTIKFIKQN